MRGMNSKRRLRRQDPCLSEWIPLVNNVTLGGDSEGSEPSCRGNNLALKLENTALHISCFDPAH